MRRKILLVSSAIALAFVANAQLRVLSNGHIQIGDKNVEGMNSTAIKSIKTDTTSTISLLGPTAGNFSGASLTFGGRKDVQISEGSFAFNINSVLNRIYGKLNLVGKGGIEYSSYVGTIFSYTADKSDFSGPFKFNIRMESPQYLTSSDARYKKDIESLEEMGDLLKDLTPVSYVLDLPSKGMTETDIQMDAPVSKEEERRNFGFIAQEVREIFPELVYEDANGMLSVDYNGFIPLLVDAYKAMNAKIAAQEEMIANLTQTANKTRGVAGVEDIYGDDSVVLMQNRPNPFKTDTEIRCHLPEGIADAFICIYDLNGR